ncbi:putative major tail protein [Escherichia phage tonnikala]|uniref:Putative major tail protein n=1 Tax=Escherichia phage tonnikala TaxID=2696452 RepID=A0A6B9X4B2_9CAUD|nr:major tail protein [Escherichia phage tonnikala]QHR71338.1 putative major tail protein [Escherichia phage tonnikala]
MHLPNGSQIFIGVNMGEPISATQISNADNPVFTTENTQSIQKGAYVLIETSSWGKLVSRVLRVKEVSDNASVTLEGVDTTDQNVFPAGSNTATFREVKSWVEIPCVQDLAQDGGEQQYYTYQCLADDQEQQLPTYKSAVSLTYTFAHEYDNPIYPILREAEESGDVTALRMYVPKAKEMRCWAGVLSFNDIPQTTMNEMETVSLSVSLKGRFTFLPSDVK